MRKRTTMWVVLSALALLTAPLPARAEDRQEPAASQSLRLYRVGALTQGREHFLSSFPPLQLAAGEPEDHRRVPGYAEDAWHPLGGIDELIELVKTHVLPAYWEETEGADISSMGSGALIIRAAPGVHAELGRYLASLERKTLRTVSVDVQAVSLTADGLADLLGGGSGDRLDPAKVAALLASDARGPAARLSLENRSSGEVFGGAQRCYLRRHQAVATEDGGTTVPLVGVANPGFAVEVVPIIHADGRSVRLNLRVSWSGTDMRPAIRTARKEVVELPAPPTLDVSSNLIVTPGIWSLAHGSSNGWSVLARATPSAGTGFGRRAQYVPLDAPFEARPGPMEVRDFDISSLSRAMNQVFGRGAYLYDTSVEGPGRDEEDEPQPPLGGEYMVELLRESVGDEATWEDPATIDAREGELIVRNTRPVLAAVQAWLDGLRRELPTMFSTQVEIVEVEAALARALLRTEERTGEAWLLDKAARAALTAAVKAGKATRLDNGVLTSANGARNVLRSGRRFEYLSTYNAVMKKGARMIEPVTARSLSGLELDLHVTLVPGARAVRLAARCIRTRLADPVRKIETAHGEIELPELETLQLRAHLSVPLGRTAVLGAAPRAGKQVLVLLTPRRQARRR